MPTVLIKPVAAIRAAGAEANHAGDLQEASTWGVKAVGAELSTCTGAGVRVAILDSGIDDSHPAFDGVTLVQEDFTGTGAADVDGHGTHCAGTVFGRPVDGHRIGVAPGVTQALIGKVVPSNAEGNSQMLWNGIDWAIKNDARVISMSLGFDFPGFVDHQVNTGWPPDLATSLALEAYRANLRMLDALMRMIKSRGEFAASTVVVAAAGNESRRELDPDYEIAASIPAAGEDVVSVGALQRTATGLRIADFSNIFPTICGPGVDIHSAKLGGGLLSLSGTSMATPHVAGVVALWWEELQRSPLPKTNATLMAKLLANASIAGLDDQSTAARGGGLAMAP